MVVANENAFISSPVRPIAANTPHSMSKDTASSSPALPSPSQLLMGKVAHLTNHYAAFSTSDCANIGFTSASSFLRPAISDGVSEGKSNLKIQHAAHEPSTENMKINFKHLKTRQDFKGPVPLEVDRHTSRGPNEGKSKEFPDISVVEAAISIHKEVPSLEKKRSKQPRKHDQSTIKKTNITKPSTSITGQKRSKAADAEFALEQQRVADGKKPRAAQSECDLGLPEAQKRRKDWTPTKKSVDGAKPLDEVEAAWSALIPCESPSEKTLDARLGKLVGSFGYADAGNTPVDKTYTSRQLDEEFFKKGRRLDLVAGITLPNPKAIPMKRSKSPKKKPQTITDKATAPFVPEEQTATSIRSYFIDPTAATSSHFPKTGCPAERDLKNRENVVSTKPPRNGKKKAKMPKLRKRPMILHSPEHAQKMAKEQDLLFGTCSQLAREESPTFLRNLQQAFKESELIEDSQSSSRVDESQISIGSTASNLSTSKLPAASRNLWAVAARDDTGQLLDVDVVDLVDTPQPSRSFHTKINTFPAQSPAVIPPEPAAIAVYKDSKVAEDGTSITPGSFPTIERYEDENMLPRSVAEASLRKRPQSKSPVKKRRKRKGSEASDASVPEMPNYRGFTNPDLQKAGAAFGFKPIKRRGEIIPLLETCWKTQNQIALQSVPPNISIKSLSTKETVKSPSKSKSPTTKRGRPPKKRSTQANSIVGGDESTVSPKKPRGRPKKRANAESPRPDNLPAAKVSDAAHAPSAPSPQRHTSAKTPQLLSSIVSLPASKAQQDTDALFAAITRAISSFPPTHNAKNLTWFEKILFYDPIVLEDLTDWLNKEGLNLVGCNERVHPSVAKRWCESQSVCCIWRESLKGGKRARY